MKVSSPYNAEKGVRVHLIVLIRDIVFLKTLFFNEVAITLSFQFEEMFFTDTFTMWFNFTLDPLRHMPMEWVFVNTTVPLEVVYYDLKELDGNGSVVLGDAFKTKTELLDLTFTIEGKIVLRKLNMLLFDSIQNKWLT